MSERDRYAIRGGKEGRERLRVLARAMHPSTAALLDRLVLPAGATCLDAGCGGGDVTLELARRVGPAGSVLGVDIDPTVLRLATREAREKGLDNVAFRVLDVRSQHVGTSFDLVYARFLLSHLAHADAAVSALLGHVRPGGLLVVEDIDFSGSFTWPESDAFHRYAELYGRVVRGRGGDPDLGRRLPLLVADHGLEDVVVHVAQPVGLEGDVKLINPLTLVNIADAVLRDGLASRGEIDALVEELYRFAADPRTLVALPRVVQVRGRRPPAPPA